MSPVSAKPFDRGRRLAAAAAWLAAAAGAFDLSAGEQPPHAARPEVRIGSKKFTESVVLGELAAHLARDAGADAQHLQELGGTQVVFRALERGDIDLYPEYTGTIREEILAGNAERDDQSMRRLLGQRQIRMSQPLGFNNTYAIGMKEDAAERLGVRTISDLRRHAGLVLGFSDEFMGRQDTWPSLRRRYRLPQTNVKGLDHDLAYRALAAGSIDATDLYSTDAEIRYYGLRVLADDLAHFPAYHAVWLYRADLGVRAPEVVASLRRLEGRLAEADMIAMNGRAKFDRVSESSVAADFMNENLHLYAVATDVSFVRRLARNTRQHLYLVSVSLAAAIAIAVPLGIWAARRPRVAQPILAGVGIIQTIPSLALLVFMIPLLGIEERPAIAALFLYSLLPIVRNTYAGLHDIGPAIRESAEALGLPPAARLRLVELPLASRAILAGIKTSAVINVGTATLGALVGAGGYGQPIFTGIRRDDLAQILFEGAMPAAAMALVVQALFEVAERRLVPKGLRLKPHG